MKVLQDLMPFPTNLKLLERFDYNELVTLLVDHYEIERSFLKIDFDFEGLFPEKPEILGFYQEIFSGIELSGKVIMYPMYLEPEVVTVTFDAVDLYQFLMEDSFRLTRCHELVRMGRQDVVFIFFDQSVVVNIDHTSHNYIARIDRKIAPDKAFLRPTLLWRKIWLWAELSFEERISVEKGTYLLRYDPSYSPDELLERAVIAKELLGFYPWDPIGEKCSLIVENASLETCTRLKNLLNNSGINVLIEERKEFKSTICLGMRRNQPDVVEE